MYNISENNFKALEKFIDSIPESMVKGNYQKWYNNLRSHERITSSEMEEFISLANNLPMECQHFPQEFLTHVKNELEIGKKIIAAEVDPKEVKEEKEKNLSLTDKFVEENKKAKEVEQVVVKKEVVKETPKPVVKAVIPAAKKK